MLKESISATNPTSAKYNQSIKIKSKQKSAYGSQNLAPKSMYK